MVVVKSSQEYKFNKFKSALKIYSKFTGEHPCRSAISIKFQSIFMEIVLRPGCSPVNLLYIFRTTFLGTALEGCFGIYKVANIVVVICCLHAVFA